MKIIHVVLGKANPHRMNGVNKVVYSLASTQHNQGRDVEVWGITPEIDSGLNYDAPYKIHLFRAHKSPFSIDESLKKKLSELPKDSIFQMHGAFIPQFYSLSKLLKDKDFQFILTPHGAYNPVALRHSFFRKLFYYFFLERTLIRRAARIHLLGAQENGYTVRFAPESKRSIIPNGQVISPDTKPVELASSPAVPIFGFMGRLDTRHKGLDLLIDAFNRYKSQYNGKGKLWMIGDGDDRVSLQQEVTKLGLDNEVVFYGKQFGDDKLALLKQLHVFLHPSRYDGIPMAVLECALMGIPAIVSEATNVKFGVDHYNSGLGLENLKPTTIAESFKTMEEIIDTEDYQSMRAGAFRMVKEEFDWENIAKRFQKLYEDILH